MQNKFTPDSWVVLSPIEQRINNKIERAGTPLKDWDIQINYGIKTGYNEAFIIIGILILFQTNTTHHIIST